MNRDLTEFLEIRAIEFEQISKSEKVRLLSRWRSEFAVLLRCARKGYRAADVIVDNAADEFLKAQKADSYYLMPDDGSGMSSIRCLANHVPDLTSLLSDTYTTCEEIVVFDAEFTWSCVLVNHGATGVGRYLMQAISKSDGR